MSGAAADAVWGLILFAFAAFEAWTVTNDRPGDTFTERTRRHFRVHTRAGAWTFFIVLGSAAAWFSSHIVIRAI